MTREELDIVERIFSIAIHSMQTEEILLKKENMQVHMKASEMPSATLISCYSNDILMRGEVIAYKRNDLFELFDKLKVTM